MQIITNMATHLPSSINGRVDKANCNKILNKLGFYDNTLKEIAEYRQRALLQKSKNNLSRK